MIDPETRLVAIVGPTAAGKTGLGISVAREFGGEVVCADSRTVYRGMDIGTAKPTAAERKLVAHHLLDVADPDEPVTAASFKAMAEAVVTEIIGRNKLPVVVGGSGLYVYGLLYDFQFPAGARTAERIAMERQPLEDLVEQLWREDPDRASEVDIKNRRRVIRALETVGLPRQRSMALGPETRLVGLRPPQEALNNNIIQRVDAMLQMGLVDEVRNLAREYDPELEVLRSPGYAEILGFLDGEYSLEVARERIILHTRQLAKRQLTWFKRNADIVWYETGDEAMADLRAFFAGRHI